LRQVAVAVLGEDLGTEAAGRAEDQALVLVVDDDEVAEQARELDARPLELLEQAGLGLLAALLEVEREVVQRERRGLLVVGLEQRPAGGRPGVGGGGIARSTSPETANVSSGEMPAVPSSSSVAVGSSPPPAASRAASAKAAKISAGL
jgi:hypothetical protein